MELHPSSNELPLEQQGPNCLPMDAQHQLQAQTGRGDLGSGRTDQPEENQPTNLNTPTSVNQRNSLLKNASCTPLPEDNRGKSRIGGGKLPSKELENLRAANLPGTSEFEISSWTRHRKPSLRSAKSAYNEALHALQEELAAFADQGYQPGRPELLRSPKLRKRIDKVKDLQQALADTAQQLMGLIVKEGIHQERSEVENTTERYLAQTRYITDHYDRAIHASPPTRSHKSRSSPLPLTPKNMIRTSGP